VDWACPSCGTVSGGAFCPACGERRQADVSPRGVRAAASPGVAWLRRLHASLNALASPPGRLTRDWLAGRRVGYIAPMALFLYTNVAFFLVQSASGVSVLSWPLRIHLENNVLGIAKPLFDWYAGPNRMANARYVAVFDALEVVHAKALVLMMVPLFAAVMLLAPAVQRTRFARSFTFAAHYYTYALIALCALFPLVSVAITLLTRAGMRPTDGEIDWWVSSIQALLLGWYLLWALRSLTPLPLWRRVLLAALLLGATVVILQAYHLVVFAFTLVSV
jgi:hypothetical protein